MMKFDISINVRYKQWSKYQDNGHASNLYVPEFPLEIVVPSPKEPI